MWRARTCLRRTCHQNFPIISIYCWCSFKMRCWAYCCQIGNEYFPILGNEWRHINSSMMNFSWLYNIYIKREILIKRYAYSDAGWRRAEIEFWMTMCVLHCFLSCIRRSTSTTCKSAVCCMLHDDAGPNSIHIQPSASIILYTLDTMATMMKQWTAVISSFY